MISAGCQIANRSKSTSWSMCIVIVPSCIWTESNLIINQYMLCVRVLGFFSDRRGESGKYRSTQRLSLPISCSWTSFQAQLPRRIQPQATPAPLSLLPEWAAGSPHLQGWQQQCFSSSLAWCRPDLYATPPGGSMGTFHPSWDNWFTWSLPYATSCEAPNWEFWFVSFFFLFVSFKCTSMVFFVLATYIYIFFFLDYAPTYFL